MLTLINTFWFKSKKCPRIFTPALFTSKSILPRSSMAVLVASQSSKSTWTGRTSGTSRLSDSKCWAILQRAWTIAPCLLNLIAIARPMPDWTKFEYERSNSFLDMLLLVGQLPWPAPVTKATLPVNLISILICLKGNSRLVILWKVWAVCGD